MKHSKFIKWLTAAALGLTAAAAFSAGMTAEAATGSGTTASGLAYSYDTETGEATITGYTGSSRDVTIPSKIDSYTVTGIGADAFRQKYLTGITIPNTVTKIGADAFGWNSIETITIPASVKTLPTSAFYCCTKLTSVICPGVTSVEGRAFHYCQRLKNVSLPKAKSIGSYAFEDCIALTDISLPKAETIGYEAFDCCSALKKVSIPKAVTIRGFAFSGCSSLEWVSMPRVQTIKEGAFRKCTSLTNISLPASTTLVETEAFSGCSSLTSLQINGPTELWLASFMDCTALTDVLLSDSSWTNSFDDAFQNCPITRVNGVNALSYQTDSNGNTYPLLNPAVETAVRNHFCRSINVKFVNDYCTALCNYIVATETDPWMNDALKARQLHDWLVRHCEYEDLKNGESLFDLENHHASSVFLSYAINVRGEGIGETVCDGYTKAYTMLLAAAEIEAYRVGGSTKNGGHAWNIVKINNGYTETYYETDVTWDDPIPYTGGSNNLENNPYSTNYIHFLKSNDNMKNLHGSIDNPTLSTDGNNEHPLLSVYTSTKEAIQTIVANATESLKDNNHDGIYDNDFDLSGGYMNSTDWTAYYECLRFLYGDDTSEQLSKKLPEVFYYLHQRHMSFWEYLNHYGPTSQTVHAGETAHFSVHLFGDGLTYRWRYWDENHWVDVNDPSASTSELSFTATPEMNGRYIICFLWNSEGVLFYPDFVSLTVI